MTENPNRNGALRIVHCFRAPVGGLFRHVLDLAGEQARRGHDVGIICDSTSGGELAASQLAALQPSCSLGVHRVPIGRFPGAGDIRAAFTIRAILRDAQPDIVHGHGAKGGVYARLLPVRGRDGQRAATAYTPHGGSLNYKPGTPISRFFLGVEGMLSARTGVFLFESAYGRDVFHERVCIPRGAERVVHNGVRPEDFVPLAFDEDATDLLFLGELREVKGIDVLIEALLLLRRERDCRPTLTIVGSGALEDELKRQAAPLGDQVRFVPAEPARRAFARGRCVVVPSRAESLPYVVLEAAALARAVIATDVGGIHEIFGPLRDRLIEAGNAEVLAARIADCMCDRPAWEQMGRELKSRIETHFSLGTMTDGVLEGYAAARLPQR